MPRKTALITGATSGIGLETAKLLAVNNYALILCGRRKDRLDQVAASLQSSTDVSTLAFDVCDRDAVASSLASLQTPWDEVDVLINNAGNAHGLHPIHEGDLNDWETMIDVNIKGVLFTSKVIVPRMVARKSGHIVNIGSIAGKEVYPNGNVYCGTKHALDAITQGMRLDLNPYGIKVTLINPGLVETEFSLVRFKGDEQRAAGVYEGMEPLVGQDVAEAVLFALSRPAHVNISDLVIFPTAQASATTVHRNKP